MSKLSGIGFALLQLTLFILISYPAPCLATAQISDNVLYGGNNTGS